MNLGTLSHCGIKKKSNITNALQHYDSQVIFTFDLRSFFPSIRPERVKRALIAELCCPEELAVLLTKLVTHAYQVPQGAPTSTDIANIVTLRLQRRLFSLSKQWGVKNLTIYADDVTFSDDKIPAGFKGMVMKVVRDEGFKVHPKKGGIFNKSHEQIVTGVNTSHGLTLGKRKKVWRAEYHKSLVQLQEGEILQQEFAVAVKKYLGRVGYVNFIKRSALSRERVLS